MNIARTVVIRPVVLEIAVPILLTLLLGVYIFLLRVPDAGLSRGSDEQVARIYISVPLDRLASIKHGVEMALEEAGGKAGPFRVELVPLNGARRLNGKWEADVERSNALLALEDPSALIYIGPYNSGAAKISIPILNRVGMVMISPGNTYPGLTKPGTGRAGEPYDYYPLGERNYWRVVPADDLQGAAAAAFAREIGAKRVFVVHDRELYGEGIATIFARSLQGSGVETIGPEALDVQRYSYTDLAIRIALSGADMVYFGGISDNGPARLLLDLRSVGFAGAFVGADGIVNDTFVRSVRQGSTDPGEVYATQFGVPAAKLTGPGAAWYHRYKSRYPADDNEDLAPYGYEAGKVALRAIEVAGRKDRDAVREAMKRISSADLPGEHILGDWNFDSNGDTSLVNISVRKLNVQQPQPWEYRGSMMYDPQGKTWSFQSEP